MPPIDAPAAGPGPRFALVAGEASGDQLGAALITELRARHPQASFFGIGGERMRAAGFEAWWDVETLSVMGLFEVIRHLPRLLRLRRELVARLVEARPDVLVGIDAPDFNLGVEKRLRARGMTTVHYVSPTVWAWRPGRARTIAQCADRVLCLFPFEPDFYRVHGVPASYTGHPLADSIALDSDPAQARAALGLDPEATTIALLPGSRGSEAGKLAAPMLEAARRLAAERPGLQFIAPMAKPGVGAIFKQALDSMDGAAAGPGGKMPDVRLLRGDAIRAMAAADVVVCASGTATLECLLVKRPMVVCYRLSGATHALAKTLNLVKTDFIALPNLLAGEALVPELIQREVTGAAIAAAVTGWLDDAPRRAAVTARFRAIHLELRCGAAASAADAVSACLPARGRARAHA